jgi:glutathione synthase/RimK-type ligase-like ATP-grasp enzyme
MPIPPIDITVLTEARYAQLAPDDGYHQQIATEEGLVMDALRALGLTVARQDWNDRDVDWRRTRAAVFRSTWDYFDRIDAFRAWLERVSPLTRLINDPALIHWNMDKHYLADLYVAGIRVVPTDILEAGTAVDLGERLDELGWDAVVIKPAISGGARLTWRADRASAADHQHALAQSLAREAMLIQPFEAEIMTAGEISLIVIDGAVTHAVRKIARPGDFRVQDDHGGTVAAHAAAEDEIAFALEAVKACPVPPVYARVDLVRGAPGLRLMEIELIEPELFFRFHPPAAMAFAQALAHAMAAGG